MAPSSSYGFLDRTPECGQDRGFFIDADNRILYWPRRRSPGYVINLETAVRIVRKRKSIQDNWRTWGLAILTFVLVLVICSLLTPLIIPILGEAPYDYLFPLTSLGISTLVTGKVVSNRFHRTLGHLLLRSPPIPRDPPPAQRIKSGPARLIGAPFILALGLVPGAFGLLSDNMDRSDRIATLTLALILITLAFALFRQSRGLDPRAVRFLEPSDAELEAAGFSRMTPAELDQAKRRLHWTRWILWSLGILLFILLPGAVGFWLFHNSISAEDLTRRFDLIAFTAPEGAPSIPILSKWETPFTVRFDQPPPGEGFTDLKDHLRAQFLAFGRATGLPFRIENKGLIEDKNKIPSGLIHVRFIAAKGDPSWSAEWRQSNGALTGVRLTFLLSPQTHFPDPRHEAIRATEAALGIRGVYKNWTPRYKMDGFTYLRVPIALCAMIYDPRLHAGMTREEADPIAQTIARELASSPSLEEWLATRAVPASTNQRNPGGQTSRPGESGDRNLPE
ncbi:MAG: DUF2927 domain-containing protein [Rhodospirillum sp.]|nr:DUF2927 domain-containing protein [Rhodospirillum sp.]MCF8488777.1 DUF2927 domain-containing protein [Rhodospirillum sp.]MCF8503045.1 DUF2927 domain-containing protein [Rhodospirillum sp.]